MPTYVYRFIDTGETIEVRQSFEDEPLTQAPHPSDGTMRPVKKVFTPVGITFKGSGFYKTDSGGTKKSSSAASDTQSSAPSDAQSTAPTSGSAPAATSPAAPSAAPSGSSSGAAASTPAK
jgi:predicted nucleic acid-binding Zn ribbon protein